MLQNIDFVIIIISYVTRSSEVGNNGTTIVTFRCKAHIGDDLEILINFPLFSYYTLRRFKYYLELSLNKL